jgi:SAM-dependent methyltransferase
MTYAQAVSQLLAEFSWNPWFLNSYWPENEPRVHLMASIAIRELRDTNARRVLEVGCANGYVAYLFSLLGFGVKAVDAYEDESRTALFQKGGIGYSQTNLNDAQPLEELADGSFDLVLLGEVFEHILNHPAGLLASVHRILRPGGLVILTSPNPSTLMNAVRILRDIPLPWGTHEFLTEIKFDDGKVINRADIHYREYPASIVREALIRRGFEIGETTYVRIGNAPVHQRGKRFLKGILARTGLAKARPFAPGYLIWARKPG